MTPTEFIRNLSPDFCWCTGFDLFLMYEQIDEDGNEASFRELLRKQVQKGIMLKKSGISFPQNRKSFLYLRVK